MRSEEPARVSAEREFKIRSKVSNCPGKDVRGDGCTCRKGDRHCRTEVMRLRRPSLLQPALKCASVHFSALFPTQLPFLLGGCEGTTRNVAAATKKGKKKFPKRTR